MEIFGAGTAAVVSPVNKILHLDDVIEIENNGFPLAQRFFDELTSIQVREALSFLQFWCVLSRKQWKHFMNKKCFVKCFELF